MIDCHVVPGSLVGPPRRTASEKAGVGAWKQRSRRFCTVTKEAEELRRCSPDGERLPSQLWPYWRRPSTGGPYYATKLLHKVAVADSDDEMNRLFRALADTTRRRIIDEMALRDHQSLFEIYTRVGTLSHGRPGAREVGESR